MIEQTPKNDQPKSSILNNGHSELDLTPKNASGVDKKSLFHKDKKLDLNDPQKKKQDVSLRLIGIGSLSQLSPIKSMAPIDK